jgi:predicted nuclease of predicted toxin-antitoxin system
VRILTDANFEGYIVDRLRADGHEVESVLDFAADAADPAVLAASVTFDAVLVSHDKDFGELVFRHNHTHIGIVLTRLAPLSPQAKCDAVSELFASRGTALIGMFTVLAPGKVRTSRPK